MPSTTALLGTVLHQQTVPCEFGAGGALVAIRSSIALTLTIGTL